jgi:hypothetical protein
VQASSPLARTAVGREWGRPRAACRNEETYKPPPDFRRGAGVQRPRYQRGEGCRTAIEDSRCCARRTNRTTEGRWKRPHWRRTWQLSFCDLTNAAKKGQCAVTYIAPTRRYYPMRASRQALTRQIKESPRGGKTKIPARLPNNRPHGPLRRGAAERPVNPPPRKEPDD